MEYSFGAFVRQAIARHLAMPANCIEPSQRLREDLGLFPLDLVLVALALEDIANARFPIERLGAVYTVEELTDFLWSCRARQSSIRERVVSRPDAPVVAAGAGARSR